MKSYGIFVFDQYYPSGGVIDLYKVVEDLGSAIALAKKCVTDSWDEEDEVGYWYFPYETAQVVSNETFEIVEEYEVGWNKNGDGPSVRYAKEVGAKDES